MKLNILVVDDTHDNLRLLANMLTEQGYKVRPAPDGHRALSSARSKPPDLILLDIMMPGMDGYEVCEQLKADELTKDIPIIFLSALNETMDKVRAFNIGGVDYITKPFQAEEVLARVKTHLELAAMRKRLQAQNTQLSQEIVEHKRTKEALLRAKELAEAANQAKSIFLSNMSHELRSPLTAIIGFTQVMDRSASLPPEHRENVDIIRRSGEHLLTLINQVLELSKIEAGRMTLDEKNVDLHRLLADLERMFRLRMQEKQLQFTVERDERVPRYLRADEVKLRQVLINLLNNAVKFTEEGGVHLSVTGHSPTPESEAQPLLRGSSFRGEAAKLPSSEGLGVGSSGLIPPSVLPHTLPLPGNVVDLRKNSPPSPLSYEERGSTMNSRDAAVSSPSLSKRGGQGVSLPEEPSALKSTVLPLPGREQCSRAGSIDKEPAPEMPQPREAAGCCLRFAVQDTGPGIAAEEMKGVFEAFVQTESGRKSREGTGLGLPISRKFVQLMGGDMQVKSDVGRGSEFSFEIQCKSAESSRVQHSTFARRVIGLQPGQPHYRILIADDRPTNRQLVAKLLAPFRFELREATDGKDAIELCKTWKPHLIWMDMRMPEIDGYEATKAIRNQEAATSLSQESLPTFRTRIIALTASSFEEERAKILAAGCDDYLRKPFHEGQLFELLNKHLGVRFVYEEDSHEPENGNRENADEDEKVLTPSALNEFPAEWLEALGQAAIRAEPHSLSKLIEQIRGRNTPLAEALARLVEDFEYEKILTLLQEHAELTKREAECRNAPEEPAEENP